MLIRKEFYRIKKYPLRVSLWLLTIGVLYGCSVNGKYYLNTGGRFCKYRIIELKRDSTSIYTFCADIKVEKEDKWILNGDTIQTHKMEFTHKGNKLIQENGSVWKKKVIAFNHRKWR
jgi:hypothetical protein